MKVFEFRQDMDHFCPWTTDDKSLEAIGDVVPAGMPVGGAWEPLVGHIRAISGLNEGDFPYWIDPMFSKRARERLEDLLDPCGEWLPVETSSSGEFFVYNVTTVIDCVDQEKSRLARTRDGLVFGAYRLDFIGAKIDHMCFRIPEGVANFYMLGEVLHRIAESGLRGLAPLEIWDSELGARHFGLI